MDYLPTQNDACFNQIYYCDVSEKDIGDKILMPASALDRLAMLEISYPMLFQLCNPLTGHVSHCGVLEFTAEEGFICLPQWMMENLRLEKGSGTYIKLQPHTTTFVELSNPKSVLENTLGSFTCLTRGDTIMIMHDNKKYYIDVVEAKPSSAISIVETDCEVDFAPPLDCQERELERLVKRLSIEDDKEQPLSFSQHPTGSKEDQEQSAMQEFIAFTGAARRLDGKAVASIPVKDCPPVQKEQRPAVATADAGSSNNSSKHGKLVFGSSMAEARESLEKEEEKFKPFTGISFKLTDE
ncbi:Ubiquitin fusion degradation protein [Salix suchowensis]|nr:Ubiquitin fusion degradation protein [Salix suchowensis]